MHATPSTYTRYSSALRIGHAHTDYPLAFNIELDISKIFCPHNIGPSAQNQAISVRINLGLEDMAVLLRTL